MAKRRSKGKGTKSWSGKLRARPSKYWTYVKLTGRFPCEICSTVFEEESQLDFHKLTHPSHDPEPGQDCRWCSKRFKLRKSLKAHERQAHGNQLEIIHDNADERTSPVSPLSGGPPNVEISRRRSQSSATLASNDVHVKGPQGPEQAQINVSGTALSIAAIADMLKGDLMGRSGGDFPPHASLDGKYKSADVSPFHGQNMPCDSAEHLGPRPVKNRVKRRKEIPDSDDTVASPVILSPVGTPGQSLFPASFKQSSSMDSSSSMRSEIRLRDDRNGENAIDTQRVDLVRRESVLGRDRLHLSLLREQNYSHRLSTQYEIKEGNLRRQIDSLKSASRQLQQNEAINLLAEKEQQISKLQQDIQRLLDGQAVLRSTGSCHDPRESIERRIIISKGMEQLTKDVDCAATNSEDLGVFNIHNDEGVILEESVEEILRFFREAQFDRQEVAPKTLLYATLSIALAIWVFASDFPNFDEDGNLLLESLREHIAAQEGGLETLRAWDLLDHAKLVHGTSFKKHTISMKAGELSSLFSGFLRGYLSPTAIGYDDRRRYTDELRRRADSQDLGSEDESEVTEIENGDGFSDNLRYTDPYVYQAFAAALGLKAEMILTTRTYDFVFFRPGTLFDGRFMELYEDTGVYGQKLARKQTTAYVLICCFPLVLEHETLGWQQTGSVKEDREFDWRRVLVVKGMAYRSSDGIADCTGQMVKQAVVVCRSL